MGGRFPTIGLLAAIGGCALAWLLPEAKEGAVAGRLDYPQFLVALASTACAISIAAVVLSPQRNRRPLVLRIVSVWIGAGVVVAAGELGALLWPVRQPFDNPWYLRTGEGLGFDSRLRLVRAPHLEWTGSSRGDLAMRTGDHDPFARTVTFRTDSDGFRNSRDIDRADIVFLGDSYTEAGNVPEEETFVARVGAELGRVARNLGRAGYAPPAELIVLEQYGLENQPRFVVWQIAESNDLEGALRYQQWWDSGHTGSSREPPGTSRAQAWQRRSPSQRLFQLLRRPSPWPFTGTFRDAQGELHEVRLLPRLPSRLHKPAEHEGWPILSRAIEDGARLSREHGIRLIVLLVPMKLRVMGDHLVFRETRLRLHDRRRKIAGRLPPGWDLHPRETLATHLGELCATLGIAFIDATAALREHTAAGELVYLPMDTHLSSRGHEVVSRLVVASILASEGTADSRSAGLDSRPASSSKADGDGSCAPSAACVSLHPSSG